MAGQLLRLNKDAATAKFNLTLFTTSRDDNKVLAARVARLEAELAGSALAYGHKEEGLYALCAAAAAYRELGNLMAAASCLQRAQLLKSGDDELKGLLDQAVADLHKKLNPPAASKPKPKPLPKAVTEPELKEAPKEEAPKKPLFSRKKKKSTKKKP